MQSADRRKAAWSYVLDEPTRVLVVDDDPILREFASVHLSSPTATVLSAGDGEEGFALLNSEPCDIAILDIDMPKLDGFRLLEKIRADATLATLPVMMLTGHESISAIDRAFELGATAFVSKPVNWRLLSYHIRYVLRNSRIESHLGTRSGNFAKSASQAALQAILHETNAILADWNSESAVETRLLRLKKLTEGLLRKEVGASAALCPPLES